MAEPLSERERELEEGRMAFIEHLRDLRLRLRNSIIALSLGFVACLKFSEDIFIFLAAPLMGAWRTVGEKNPAIGEPSFYFTGLVEPFWTYFSMAFWGGIFVASPLIFYQVWKFIAPGLYRNERRWGVLFSVASAILFIGGAAFCYLIVLPAVCEFLLNYASENLGGGGAELALRPILTMKEYLAIAKRLLLGFGLIFELPLLIFVLALAGAVTHRSLWKFNRWAVLLAFVASALLTPPDIYSQLFMAAPLIVLYNLSIILAYFVTKAKEREAKKYE